jgi:hypothetical protein
MWRRRSLRVDLRLLEAARAQPPSWHVLEHFEDEQLKKDDARCWDVELDAE